VLGWQPRYENLDFIVETALNWEKKLALRNATA
jgi:UDP-glucose 4-epimerase